MKRCPTCNRVEIDDALVFCRADGTALVIAARTELGVESRRKAPRRIRNGCRQAANTYTVFWVRQWETLFWPAQAILSLPLILSLPKLMNDQNIQPNFISPKRTRRGGPAIAFICARPWAKFWKVRRSSASISFAMKWQTWFGELRALFRPDGTRHERIRNCDPERSAWTAEHRSGGRENRLRAGHNRA